MYPFIDMHCDSLLRVLQHGNTSLYNGDGMQSIQKMVKAGQMCQFFAIFFAPEIEEEESYFEKLKSALEEQVELHKEQIAFAYNEGDLRKNWALGKASAVLTIEDGRIVQGNMDRVHELYQAGVRAITLTWNHPNCFGYPNAREAINMQKGLTPFGKEAIEEMNRLGILIDVSHLSDGGFEDVVSISKKPFIASHSNCRALKSHPRNLTDDMIRSLANRGGVAGINLYPAFVGGAGVEDMARHVLHFIQVGGEECVGIGSDFDGFEQETMIDSPQKMALLFAYLHQKGLSDRQLEKLASGNVLRIMKESL